MLKLRQVLPVLRQHLVDHRLDLRQREHGGGERVAGDGVEDEARVAGERGFDGHLLGGDDDLVERGDLARQRADVDGVQAALVYVDGDFDARAVRQVGDEAGVGDVAVEREGLAAHQRVDDVRGVLVAAL